MIYENAETGQDIARLLRANSAPVVVIAPRRSGKTVELLKYAEEKYPNGQFAMVCNYPNIQQIIRAHWLIFNRISQADIVAKRLLGEPLGAVDINPPLMVAPRNLSLLRGRRVPIFSDEWYLLDGEARSYILESGLFIAAVTS